jgi:hypothetical protein
MCVPSPSRNQLVTPVLTHGKTFEVKAFSLLLHATSGHQLLIQHHPPDSINARPPLLLSLHLFMPLPSIGQSCGTFEYQPLIFGDQIARTLYVHLREISILLLRVLFISALVANCLVCSYLKG